METQRVEFEAFRDAQLAENIRRWSSAELRNGDASTDNAWSSRRFQHFYFSFFRARARTIGISGRRD